MRKTPNEEAVVNRRQFLVASSFSCLGIGCARTQTPTPRTLPAGLTAKTGALPEFSLPDLDGKIGRSGDFTGSVLILRFWATW
jgi:hypothetical protein